MQIGILGLAQQALEQIPEEFKELLPDEITRGALTYPAPDNVFYSTSENDTFSGTAGQTDYFVFDLNQNAGSDVINKFDLEQDKIFLVSRESGQYSIASVSVDAETTSITYESSQASSPETTRGEILVNTTSEAFVWANITSGLIFT